MGGDGRGRSGPRGSVTAGAAEHLFTAGSRKRLERPTLGKGPVTEPSRSVARGPAEEWRDAVVTGAVGRGASSGERGVWGPGAWRGGGGGVAPCGWRQLWARGRPLRGQEGEPGLSVFTWRSASAISCLTGACISSLSVCVGGRGVCVCFFLQFLTVSRAPALCCRDGKVHVLNRAHGLFLRQSPLAPGWEVRVWRSVIPPRSPSCPLRARAHSPFLPPLTSWGLPRPGAAPTVKCGAFLPMHATPLVAFSLI